MIYIQYSLDKNSRVFDYFNNRVVIYIQYSLDKNETIVNISYVVCQIYIQYSLDKNGYSVAQAGKTGPQFTFNTL
ncbi:hypothetical protein FC84_GL000180 [Lapidilactobacillus dextrinicus DSM 20335]|uniref:Uncharacterized protein n=1 Tax=Lapidilactobacillus dextrinicus DSM 20335 TaxID=1423738 RepID=A0A0R2BHI1_9LACO|nr:hypothetical protein FC84_GL000180 [Lapidilactobacillus dextrinicus DSM 20335]